MNFTRNERYFKRFGSFKIYLFTFIYDLPIIEKCYIFLTMIKLFNTLLEMLRSQDVPAGVQDVTLHIMNASY